MLAEKWNPCDFRGKRLETPISTSARDTPCALFIDRETPVTRSTLSYPLKLRARGRVSRLRERVFLQIKDQAAPIRKRRYVNWYSRSRVLRFRINLLENDRHRRRHLAARALQLWSARPQFAAPRLFEHCHEAWQRSRISGTVDRLLPSHKESKRYTMDPFGLLIVEERGIYVW